LYDGDTAPTDSPLQHDQPEDHPTRSANVTAPAGLFVLEIKAAQAKCSPRCHQNDRRQRLAVACPPSAPARERFISVGGTIIRNSTHNAFGTNCSIRPVMPYSIGDRSWLVGGRSETMKIEFSPEL
jgi:hypothetical protein